MSDLPPQDNQPRSLYDTDDVIGAVLGGRYRVVALIGAGASARVYLADDVLLDRQVAVKCLRPGLIDDSRFLRRFRAEAKATAQLSHPNLLAVYDWGEDKAEAYLVTEVLLGGSLLDLLERGHRLTPSQGLLVALQVAQGLHFAHGLGWVHRDIKPANLLFGVEGRLRIADFGIARAVAEAAWTEPEGVLVGTTRYAAPEQAEGGPIDSRADVYSLALAVVEAVTGDVPLLGASALATMMMRRDHDLGPLRRLGPLGDALEPAGRADPATRPSAASLIESLTRAARSLPRPLRLPLGGPDPTPSQETDRIVAFRSEEPVPTLGGRRASPGALALGVGAGSPVPTPDDPATEIDLAVEGAVLVEEDVSVEEVIVDVEIDLVVERLPDDEALGGRGSAGGPEASDECDHNGDGHHLRPGDRIKSRPIPLPVDLDDVMGFAATTIVTAALDDDAVAAGDEARDDVADDDFLAAGLSLFSGMVLGELESPPVPPAARPRSRSDEPSGGSPAERVGSPTAPHRRSNVDEVLADLGIADEGTLSSAPSPSSPVLDEDVVPVGPVRLSRLFDLDPIEPDLVPGPFSSVSVTPAAAHAHVAGVPVRSASPPARAGNAGYDLPAPPEPIEQGIGPFPLHPSDRARGIVAVLVGTAAVASLIVGLVVVFRPAAEETAPPTRAPVVDALVGRSLVDVIGLVETYGWELTTTELRQDGTAAGEIVAQQPQPGRPLGPGGQLAVAVSLGPELRTVPSIVGRTVDEAAGVLADSRLAVGVVTHRHDRQTAEGRVLALRVGGVTPSSQLETGTGVDLVVSAGPPAVPLPSFVGLSHERALARAADLGLVVVEERDHSRTYPEGQVVHTEPPTGAAVSAGDGITLVLSLGPPFAVVPDVVGLGPIEAADRLTAAGFVVVDTVGPPDQGVTATAPSVGESHPEGTSIVLLTED